MEEIHEARGVLFKRQKIIIPASMKQDMLSIIHETHMGVEKSKRRARAVMYWPQMAEQIEDTVRKCPICMRFRKSSPKELLLSHAIPADPWC